MLIDKQLVFSDDQAITASAASTNVIDLGEARDIGNGEELFLYIQVTETLDDVGDNSTITPKLETYDNEAFGSATTLRTYEAITANKAAGSEYFYRLEPASYERYIRLYYTVANGDLSAGKLTATIVKDIPKQRHYPTSTDIA